MKYLTKIKNIDDLWQVIKRKSAFVLGRAGSLRKSVTTYRDFRNR